MRKKNTQTARRSRRRLAAHGSAIRRLPASIQKIFGGEITSSTVAEYHRLWAAWHRNMIRLNKVYNCPEDDEIHQSESLLHDAMADAVSPNAALSEAADK